MEQTRPSRPGAFGRAARRRDVRKNGRQRLILRRLAVTIIRPNTVEEPRADPLGTTCGRVSHGSTTLGSSCSGTSLRRRAAVRTSSDNTSFRGLPAKVFPFRPFGPWTLAGHLGPYHRSATTSSRQDLLHHSPRSPNVNLRSPRPVNARPAGLLQEFSPFSRRQGHPARHSSLSCLTGGLAGLQSGWHRRDAPWPAERVEPTPTRL